MSMIPQIMMQAFTCIWVSSYDKEIATFYDISTARLHAALFDGHSNARNICGAFICTAQTRHSARHRADSYFCKSLGWRLHGASIECTRFH